MPDKEKIKKNPDMCEDDIETVEGSKKPATDVYNSIKCHIKETNVEIPTEDAVKKAKEWVDDENIK